MTRIPPSSPLIRFFKWTGLWVGFLGSLYLYNMVNGPEKFRISNDPHKDLHLYKRSQNRKELIDARKMYSYKEEKEEEDKKG